MPLVPSTMQLNLGATAPDFELLDTVSGTNKSLQQLKSNVATVIMFICNHCPFVQHIQNKIADLAKEFHPHGVQFIAISSNDVLHYPEDSPEEMKKTANHLGYIFPYLYDDTQEVAKAYSAACTPDFFVFDKDLRCVYRGRFDDSTPGKKIPVTGKELVIVLNNILSHQPIDPDQKPSIGCNIKWKS